MTKKILLSIGWIGISLLTQAQQRVTLQELIQGAERHYPLIRQKEALLESGRTTDKLLDASLIPTVSLVGQGTYQSEVTAFSIPGFSGIPSPKKDNYNIGFDLHFPLTEFGVVRSKKEVEEARTDVGLKQLDVELQRLRERVTNIAGNILMQQENEKILVIRQTELANQKKKIAVAVSNGAMLKSNQLVFESEILNTEEKIIDVEATIQGLTQELTLLTGQEIGPKVEILLQPEPVLQNGINRPELKLFNAQIKVLEYQKISFRKENLPKLAIFGQGNYGRPGYNFLNNDFRLYGIAGLSLNWNINNFIIQKGRIQLYDINQKMIEAQKETFDMNLQVTLTQKETEIKKYDSFLSKDEEIVNKRKEILSAFASQLENGVITSTEYLTELNSTNAAELGQALHKIQKTIAQTQYNLLAGN